MIPERELNLELLKLIKSGEEKAFRILFNSYFPGLLAFAKEYVHDEEVAKSFVQESFLKLWENRQKLKADSNLKAYLYQILRNNALNYLKAEKVKHKYEERLKYLYNNSVLNYDALNLYDFDSVSFQELTEIIEQTIQQLPPQCKHVFMLSRYESLKNREIAEQLGISVKAVEGHISKALKKLRTNLKHYYPTGVLSVLMAVV